MFLIDRIPRTLKGFFNPLRSLFEKRQWPHFWGFVLAMCIANGRRNVKNIYNFLRSRTWRQRLNDFLCNSPWDSKEVLQKAAKTVLWQMNPKRGELLELIIDGSKNRKRGSTMEGTFWFFDHVAKTSILGHKFVIATLRFRGITIPWEVQLYLPIDFCLSEAGQELGVPFQTQNEIAAEIISSFPKQLARFFHVRVLFDSGFLNRVVVKACKKQDFRYVSTANVNRCFFPENYQKKRIVGSYGPGVIRYEGREIRIPGYRGQQRFRVAERCGKMNKIGHVKAVFSKRVSDNSFLTLVTDDFSLSARDVVIAYKSRWSVEVLLKNLKQVLGLGDYQTGYYEGVVNHLRLSCIAHLLLTHLGLKGLSQKSKRMINPAIGTPANLQNQLRSLLFKDIFKRVERKYPGNAVCRILKRYLRSA